MSVRRTSTRLADGRELIYFDEPGSPERTATDRRDLPETSTRSEIRYDPLLEEWVAIASHRQGRTFLPPSSECPLDPSSAQRSTEVPESSYDVVVFENRFPSLAQSVPEVSDNPAIDIVPRRPGVGRCEVVCFTADHNASFGQLPPTRVGTVLEAWIDRTVSLGTLPGVEQVFVFENRGEEIGVTLSHPHGQIYAYPFVPPKIERMLASARRHREATGSCLFCTVLESERKAEIRVVAATSRWTAFVPAAARWPYEVHVYPNRHVPDLPALDEQEKAELPGLYLDVLARFDGLFDTPAPYIAAWMQAPTHADRELAHLHAQVFTIRRAPGKLKFLAGSESAAGVFINDIAPEQAAQRLREAVPAAQPQPGPS